MTTVDELEIIGAELDAATRPEDVFGKDWDGATMVYRRLARASHPDRNNAQRDIATKTQAKLNVWWGKAQQRHERGRYGSPSPDAAPVTLASAKGSYRSREPWRRGDICELYQIDDAPG